MTHVPRSSIARERQAADLYEQFSGHETDVLGTVDIADHDTAVVIGELDGVLYSTVRDGVQEKYIHEFKKKSRPLLAVSGDGKQLYILEGGYIFTETGINDR